jgi:hypothetical protein
MAASSSPSQAVHPGCRIMMIDGFLRHTSFIKVNKRTNLVSRQSMNPTIINQKRTIMPML